jgi:uncharacterized membrane protein
LEDFAPVTGIDPTRRAGGFAIVALLIHWMAAPVPGLGIAVPVFMPV